MSISRYRVKTEPVCRPESVIRGENYRISVLTEALLRLEYAPDGVFEDRATQMVFNRNFPKVDFRVEESEGKLELFTSKLHLIYDKQEFSPSGLQITVHDHPINKACPPWRYGDPTNTGGNWKGTARTLDGANGEIKLDNGILSGTGYACVDDSETMALQEDGWAVPRASVGKDLYFFGYGGDCHGAMRDFYRLCGPQPVLPRYALGNWWSWYHPYTDEEYRTMMERFQKENIPFSVGVLDMDWHYVQIDPKYGSGWTGYTWNRELFPDPKAFLDWAHSQNLKITLNVHPADGIRGHEDAYPAAAEAMGIDPVTERPVTFDATDPKFMEVYFDKVHHPLEDDGVDFWWLDWQQGSSKGTDPLWVLNHYHYLDSMRRGTRGITFSRYAGPGSHRYPVGFSGDTHITWDSLRFQPYFTATASNIGYGWWSHDIGGHMLGKRDDELSARWYQLGAFSPILRLHSSNNEFSGKEPWKYSRDAEAAMGKYLRLRHELIPYLYSMSYRANREGIPLIRPLFWEDPVNKTLLRRKKAHAGATDYSNSYFFGSQMLVHPITSPMDPEARVARVDAWFPKGDWFDFFTGIHYVGGRGMALYRDLDDIPVMVKAGGIVPLQGQRKQINDVSNPEHFDIHVFPGESGSFDIMEDRDEANDVDANWARTTLKLTKDAFTIRAEGNLDAIPEKRSYTVRLRSVESAKVEVIGADAEIRYDKQTRTIVVEIPRTPVTQTITVAFPQGLKRAENPVQGMVFQLLSNAQIPYLQKQNVMNAIYANGLRALPTAMSQLDNQTLGLAILEIMTAED